MIELLHEWAQGALERAPELVILAVVAWDLRSQLKECIAHNTKMMDELFRRAFGD